ncbi:MAG: sigma-70 family RNA polymerase sigma factor [Planctomycetales bacterium]|nr:sigma-70 family RNA polymerase sigma factor [Planctomycetales bacterium]
MSADALNDSFDDFLQRIRIGDARAAEEFVRRYEPLIRREVRLRWEDERLSRLFDSQDVTQSVLASFFLRATAGQYDLQSPEQLAGLLLTMARNKMASRARHSHRQCRDSRRQVSTDHAVHIISEKDDNPAELVAGQELIAEFRARLTAEESQLSQMRQEGRTWTEIAEALGGSAEARRMQLNRAVDRIAQELGIGCD